MTQFLFDNILKIANL